jgi:predicted DCC family thiol-disulfide oxidoreductase YuxK
MDRLGDRVLVVFDGHCGFCYRSVRWLARRDRRDRLRFAASDAPQVAELVARQQSGALVKEFGSGTNAPGTILVVRNVGSAAEEVLIRSDAVTALLGELPSPWPAVAAIFKWIPRPLRDFAYGLIVRGRYRIWGRLASCPAPVAGERERFL